MRAWMLIGLVVISGCQKAPEEDPRIAGAKKLIALKLKDPASAQWRAIKVKPNGAVCGEVNAKNEYGGYPGFKLFVDVPMFLTGQSSVNPEAGAFLSGADNTVMVGGELRQIDVYEMIEVYCDGRSREAARKTKEAFDAMAGS